MPRVGARSDGKLLRVTAHQRAQQAQLRSEAGAGVAKQQVEPDAELTPQWKTAVLHLREQAARFLA